MIAPLRTLVRPASTLFRAQVQRPVAFSGMRLISSKLSVLFAKPSSQASTAWLNSSALHDRPRMGHVRPFLQRRHYRYHRLCPKGSWRCRVRRVARERDRGWTDRCVNLLLMSTPRDGMCMGIGTQLGTITYSSVGQLIYRCHWRRRIRQGRFRHLRPRLGCCYRSQYLARRPAFVVEQGSSG